MKKILSFIATLVLVFFASFSPAHALTPFFSNQLGTSPSNGQVLQTDGTNSHWVATSTLGFSGGVTSVFGRTGAVVATAGDYTTAMVTEVTNLYFTNARAIAATLTGFSATTGTVSSTDSILVAIEKLAGNAASYLTNITGLITPGTNVTISGSGTSGSPYVINATGGSTGLATSSPIASSNLLEYSSTGAGSAFGVATSTLSASSPLTGSFTQIGSGGALGIQAASASQNGYLALTDYQLLHTATTTAGTGLTYSGNAFNVNTTQNITTLSNLTTGFVQATAGVLSSAALTSGQVTTALGFTPFGGTNPLPIANGGTNATSFTTSGNDVYWNGTSLATAPLTSAITIPYASSTGFSSSYASSTNAFFGNVTLPSLGIPAGQFAAYDPTGKLIGTTTPSGSGSGTVGSGTTGQLPYYAANGTTLTATSSIMLLASGAFKNANGDLLTGVASYVVSTTTATGNFTDVQSAINALPAGGGFIHVRCGTYTLPTGAVGIQPKVTGTIIQGEGVCTQFNFNQANTPTAIEPATDNLTNIVLEDFYIHQTNATFGGVGINASNTPLLLVQNVKIDQTATSTSIKDTKNESFYQRWENLDLRNNNSCIDIGGLPVNDNMFENIRCGQAAGGQGFALFMTSSSVNGAQDNTFTNFDAEPIGSATGITAIYANNAVDDLFINPYIEGNAVGWNLTANSQRINFQGGEFLSNTTYTNNGSNNQWLGVDKEGVAYQLIQASSTIADVSGNDATSPSLSFIGNNNFAKTSNAIKIAFANSTDSGVPLLINNPGTGTTTQLIDTGTGYAFEVDDQANDKTPFVIDASGNTGVGTSTPWRTFAVTGTVAFSGLSSNSGTLSALCLNGSKEVETDAANCITSTERSKQDIHTFDPASALREVMAFNPVSFFYKPAYNGGYSNDPNLNGEQVGFTAEQIRTIDPRLITITTATTTEPDGTMAYPGMANSVRYENMVAVLTAAIQYQQKEIQALGGGKPLRSMEENWQWLAIGVLVLWNVFLTFRKKK